MGRNDRPLAQVRVIDFQETIPIVGTANVTLRIRDGNGHEVANTGSLKPTGVAGSNNFGQFVQLNVVSATR